MKICTNCGSLTELPTDKCPSCHMSGGMRRYEPEQPTAPQPAEPVVGCFNCGSPEPGNGPKCKKCHFPLVQRRQPIHYQAQRRAV